MPDDLRSLEPSDYDKGYLTLLAQLTTVGHVTKEAFKARLKELENSGDYRVAVIEDVGSHTIVATATLLVERKFIHECGKVGHIEDVVVDAKCRGQRLGNRLLTHLMDAAKELGCYKVILDCAQDNVTFYEKCGLNRKEVQMVKYF